MKLTQKNCVLCEKKTNLGKHWENQEFSRRDEINQKKKRQWWCSQRWRDEPQYVQRKFLGHLLNLAV